MDLKHTEHIRNTVSLLYNQKIGRNSESLNFLGKKSILANISYVDRFSWFWYQWKEESYPIVVPTNYTIGVSILSSQGVVTTTLERRVTKKKKKRLRKTRVKAFIPWFFFFLPQTRWKWMFLGFYIVKVNFAILCLLLFWPIRRLSDFTRKPMVLILVGMDAGDQDLNIGTKKKKKKKNHHRTFIIENQWCLLQPHPSW